MRSGDQTSEHCRTQLPGTLGLGVTVERGDRLVIAVQLSLVLGQNPTQFLSPHAPLSVSLLTLLLG